MDIVIRADGGPEIGYGHLVRTGALAGELLQHGHGVTYATTTPKHVDEVCPDGVETDLLPTRDDPAPTREFVRDYADVTVTDSYLVDETYQRQLREVSSLVVVTDDTRHRVAADVLVNGNLYANDLEYEFIGESPEQCLGTDYVLLRPEIQERANQDIPWREEPSRAIITMGGSDIRKLTPTVIHAFDRCNIHVDAIVGPGCSTQQERAIRDAAEKCSTDVRVDRDPDDFVERMAQADFAVSTASSTTYELLALGTPVVSILVAENQRLITSALRNRNLATVLEQQVDREKIASAIEQYTNDSTIRRDRTLRGRNLVDARGTTRVATELLKCC